MSRARTWCLRLIVLAMVCWLAPMTGQAAGVGREVLAQYILETVRAFRTMYTLTVIEHLKDAGISPNEEWKRNGHAVPLPIQFVKSAGADLDSFEVGVISLTPINEANLPKTPAESEALRRLQADPSVKLVTFMDEKEFKGMAGDYAVAQGCADCHNHHPKSVKRNVRKGDLLGGLVVRLKP